MSEKLRILFAGTPEIAKVVLAKMISAGFIPELVLSQPDRPAGRGMKLTASPVKVLALEHGIEVLQPVSFKKCPEVIDQIREFAPDIMVVVAYGLILPQQLLDIPRLGCINIHVSLLPRWRGAAPIQRAVLAGDTESGVTIMQMDAGLDTGDILLVERVAIAEDETSGSLYDKLALMGAEMLIKYLQNPDGYKAVAQSELGVSYATKIEKDEARIDWANDAQVIARNIRGYNPFPGAFSNLDGVLHKIWSAKPLAQVANEFKPGTILQAEKDKLLVACGNGTILEVIEIQEAGAKRKRADIFLQGKTGLKGKKFEGT